MATEKTETPKAPKNSSSRAKETDWEELPDPIFIDGYAVAEEGVVIEGTLLEREEGQYGGTYKVRISAPVKVKDRSASTGFRTVPRGGIVGVSEYAKLRQLQNYLPPKRRDPMVVRIEFLSRKADDKGWELSLKVRPAF